VRLRERKIGPYKYPTIDRTKEEKNREKNRAINPEKAEHTRQNQGEEETQKKKTEQRPSKKNRVKQSIQNLHRERNQLCRCLYPCRKRPKNQYPQKPASSFSFPGKQKEKAKVTNSLPHHHQKQKAFKPTPVLHPSSPSPETESSRTPPTLQPSSQSPETGAPVSICFCSSVFKLNLNSAKVI